MNHEEAAGRSVLEMHPVELAQEMESEAWECDQSIKGKE